MFPGGYGTTLLNLMRKANCSRESDELELPLTLGRDFAGVVVSKGHSVGNKLELGEEVWGVVPPEQQGCHANYVVVNSKMVRQILFLKYQISSKHIMCDLISYILARHSTLVTI